MFAKLQGRPGHYLLLLAVGLALFVNNLGGSSLWDLDEGRNATAALEMLEAGNFVVPTFNSQLRVDKPVLLYWLQIAAYRCFGINEFAARFPSALAALGILILCYELGRALFCPSTALLGGLVLGSTAMVVGAARFANPDAVLNFFIAFTLTLFWRGHTAASSSRFIGMGILLGFAALTKGPVGILLPALVIVTFLVWERRLALLWDRRIWHGVIAMTLVAFPWYVWVAIATRGSFLQGFFWEHHLRRYLYPLERHTGSPFYYLVVLLVGLMPWSIFLFFPTWYGVWSTVRVPWHRGEKWWRQAAENAAGAANRVAAYRFLGAWLACYLVFFSLSATKLPNYLLPAALPLALLIARFLDRWRRGEIQPRPWVMLTCLAGMAGTGIATCLAFTFMSGKFPFYTHSGPLILGLEYWGLVGLVPVAAASAGLWSWRLHRRNGVVLSFVLGGIFFMAPLVAYALPAWNQVKASRPLVERTGALRRHEDIRIGAFNLEHLPSLNFYSQREVIHHENEAEALAFLHYQVPVYLFLPARRWDALKVNAPATSRLIAHHPDLYRFDDIVVVTNFPAIDEP